MALDMRYGLRVELVLTLDGRDVADADDMRALIALRSLGMLEAASELGMSVSTLRRRVRSLERRLGGAVRDNDGLTPLGREVLGRMEVLSRQLEEQMENLWRKPTLTCDGLVIWEERLLLIRRGREPFKGHLALPGGIMEYGESAESCVMREVLEETGLRTEVVRLVGVFSAPERDPRGHFVTLLYELKVVGGELGAGDDAESAILVPLEEVPPLAFDHSELVAQALKARYKHH
jgi:8-oxo-dGTP diphosphatase